jgi:hypothetical protein
MAIPIRVPDYFDAPKKKSEESSTAVTANAVTTPAAASGTPEQANVNNGAFTIGKTLFLYRLGIGELQFNPLNIQVKESININSNIEDQIYAKTNPFVSYTNTNRSFDFDFTITQNRDYRFFADNSSGLIDSFGNSGLAIMQILKSFLYANYERKQDSAGPLYARTIKSPPIFKLVFKNLVSNGDVLPNIPEGSLARSSGLLGVMKGFKLDPYYNAGYIPNSFGVKEFADVQDAAFIQDQGTYSKIKISFTFVPIFEEPMGWEIGGEQANFSGVREIGGQINGNIIKKILGN